MEQATVLIVSGPPAAGKTTLAAMLGVALGWPVFTKDAIKESLFDSLGYSDRAWSRTLGMASVLLLFQIIEQEIVAGRSIIAECNFSRDYDAPRLARLTDNYSCSVREVHCTADTEVLIARFIARWERGERHAGHVETTQEGELRARIASGAHAPLLPPAHVLTVDTTDFATRADDTTLIAAVRTLIA